jgi:hypothetical protein
MPKLVPFNTMWVTSRPHPILLKFILMLSPSSPPRSAKLTNQFCKCTLPLRPKTVTNLSTFQNIKFSSSLYRCETCSLNMGWEHKTTSVRKQVFENKYQRRIFSPVNISSSSSSGHEVRPINDPFRPHYCIPLIVSLTVVHVFVFR